MSFGKNPHVAKAEAAEQKAEAAGDTIARVAAFREAAHQWERAAAREQQPKRRTEYEANAERNRAAADDAESEETSRATPSAKAKPKTLN